MKNFKPDLRFEKGKKIKNGNEWGANHKKGKKTSKWIIFGYVICAIAIIGNEGLSEEYQIGEENFEDYFGSVLLNVRREPVDTTPQELIIIVAIFVLFVLFVTHISLAIEKNRVKKYLKKNDYEEELARQLDDFVEEKHYKDKVILTKDFFVDLKYGGFVVFKYLDVKWIHIHNVRTYGVTTTSNLIVYLRDGKTKLTCLKTNGKATDEFMEIFNKICEKVPANSLKGYTPENREAYKQYKKEL